MTDLIAEFVFGSAWRLALLQLIALPFAALLLAHATRRHPARAHAILAIGLCISFIAPVLTLVVSANGLGGLPGPRMAIEAAAVAPLVDDDETARATWPWLALAMATAWAAVAAIRLARTAAAFRRGSTLTRVAAPFETPLARAALRDACARTHVAPRDVALLVSHDVASPVIYAWSSPARVLLPGASVDGMTARTLEAVLVHEIAHRRRFDHVWQLLGEIASSLVPWHPALGAVRRSLQHLSDQACDAWVVAAGHEPAVYAAALLHFVRNGPTGCPSLAALGCHRTLVDRIRTILDAAPAPPRCGRRCLATLLTAGALATATVAVAQPGPVRIETPPALDPAILDAAPIQAVQSVVDLGEVAPNGIGTGTITLVNAGRRTVRVERAKVACGCTTVEPFAPRDLAPGDTVSLDVTMTAPETRGTAKDRAVTFYFYDQEPLPVTIRLATTK